MKQFTIECNIHPFTTNLLNASHYLTPLILFQFPSAHLSKQLCLLVEEFGRVRRRRKLKVNKSKSKVMSEMHYIVHIYA